MTEAWTPICLVPACDAATVNWEIPVATVDENLTVRFDGVVMRTNEYFPRIFLAISLSLSGSQIFDRLEIRLSEDGRTLFDLRADEVSVDLVSKLVSQKILEYISEAQVRIVRQQREIAGMRAMIERNLSNFEKLEAFVWQTGKGERQLTHHFEPTEGNYMVVDGVVEQRLPTDATGLSDLAVWIDSSSNGYLSVQLFLNESGEQIAEWVIENPVSGWLRLSLARALPCDSQTPVINFQFSGTKLLVGRSVHHPDGRFQCRGGAMLAIRAWKFVPGVTAPMPPDAHGPKVRQKSWIIDLSNVSDTIRDSKMIEYLDWAGAVALHPESKEMLTLRIPRLVRPDMKHIQAVLSLKSVEAAAEVALSLPGGEPAWHKLKPYQANHVHFFPQDLDAQCDLVLTLRALSDTLPVVYLERIQAFG